MSVTVESYRDGASPNVAIVSEPFGGREALVEDVTDAKSARSSHSDSCSDLPLQESLSALEFAVDRQPLGFEHVADHGNLDSETVEDSFAGQARLATDGGLDGRSRDAVDDSTQVGVDDPARAHRTRLGAGVHHCPGTLGRSHLACGLSRERQLRVEREVVVGVFAILGLGHDFAVSDQDRAVGSVTTCASLAGQFDGTLDKRFVIESSEIHIGSWVPQPKYLVTGELKIVAPSSTRMDTLDDRSLPQRVVLLGLATLEQDDESPAQVNVITRRAQTKSESVDDIGRLTEAEVDRALNVLEAQSIVTVPSIDDSSPVGKGRPAYELDTDVDVLLDELDDDDRLTAAVDQARRS